MRSTRLLMLILLVLGLACSISAPARAQTAATSTSDLVNALGQGSFDDRIAAIKALVDSHDSHVNQILQDLTNGQLYVSSDGGPVYLQGGTDDAPTYADPITGAIADPSSYDPDTMGKVKINNAVRSAIDGEMSALTLLSPDRSTRFAAAANLLQNADPANLDLLNKALAEEKDGQVKTEMEAARADTTPAETRVDRWLCAVVPARNQGRDDAKAASPIVAKRSLLEVDLGEPSWR